MSMFRAPNDDSTSDSASSSDDEDVHGSSFAGSGNPLVPDRAGRGSAEAPLQRDETASESIPGNEHSPGSTDWLPNTAEQHATLLTSSLLEFAYTVKAAEHLNHVQGTSRFHRDSPEARALGALMYQGASKVLASSGIVADCVHEEDWRQIRQQYIIGVDNLGLQAFNESMSRQVNLPRGRHSHQDSNMLIRRTSRPRQDFLNVLSSTRFPAQLADGNQHHEMMAAMLRSLAIPLPYADLPLSSSLPTAGGNRYKAEFWELKRLGRGGFGTVYHVKNFVDNRDYAIKKIPLDSKRLKKWQTSGTKEVEALLKEIRTLARLEHSNIVRYYSAWIEGADEPTATVIAAQKPLQLYLKDMPASSDGSDHSSRQRFELPVEEWRKWDSIDVVFKNVTPQHSVDLPNGRDSDSMGIVFGEDSDNLSQTHDVSQPGNQMPIEKPRFERAIDYQPSSASSKTDETDIFTDDNGEVRSAELREQNALGQPVMVLHIQMSLHPLSLCTYLACPKEEIDNRHARHCFHLGPSLRLIRAILSGVKYLHSQGIIHRDLKPGNIFLSEHGEYDQRPGCVETTCSDCKPPKIKCYLNPRIGDFGLVADISGLHDEKTSVEASSASSKAVGTEFYRPPLPPPPPQQQHSCQAVDEKIDVFALGILLFELLWKMNTKMERHMLLTDLSTKAVLPQEFASKIDPGGRVGRTIDGAEDDGAEPLTIGECVEACIRNMVSASPARRWGCERVSRRLDELIQALG